MKVLLAIDESAAADTAVNVSIDLLNDDDDILVLTVADQGAPRLSPIGIAAEQFEDGLRDDSIDDNANAARTNAQSAQELAQTAADSVDADVALSLEGDPGRLIVETAIRSSAELIIVGRSDRGAIARFFHGSVSQYVLENAPCSVLVAR
jgi:nucleotide-binding universal stress UspA family protein